MIRHNVNFWPCYGPKQLLGPYLEALSLWSELIAVQLSGKSISQIRLILSCNGTKDYLSLYLRSFIDCLKHWACDVLLLLFNDVDSRTPLHNALPLVQNLSASYFLSNTLNDQTAHVEGVMETRTGFGIFQKCDAWRKTRHIKHKKSLKSPFSGQRCLRNQFLIRSNHCGAPDCTFSYHFNLHLSRKPLIEVSLQNPAPSTLQSRSLNFSCCPTLPAKQGKLWMYYTMGCEYYLSHVANDAYKTMQDCRKSTWNCDPPSYKHTCSFSEQGPPPPKCTVLFLRLRSLQSTFPPSVLISASYFKGCPSIYLPNRGLSLSQISLKRHVDS